MKKLVSVLLTLALLLGFAYLLVRRVVAPTIPLCYLGTVLVIALLCGQPPLYHLLSGGLLLGAIFMATDYTTSPVTKTGRVIFGIGCGLLTVLIRYFGSYSEGVSYSILIMNACVWIIDRYVRPRRFGVKRFRKAGADNGK